VRASGWNGPTRRRIAHGSSGRLLSAPSLPPVVAGGSANGGARTDAASVAFPHAPVALGLGVSHGTAAVWSSVVFPATASSMICKRGAWHVYVDAKGRNQREYYSFERTLE